MTARRRGLDPVTVRAVVQALTPLAREAAEIRVSARELSSAGCAVSDPDPAHGLCPRLLSLGVERIRLGPELEEGAVHALLAWLADPEAAPGPVSRPGLRLEPASWPPASAGGDVERQVRQLARDPDSGLDLIALVDGSGPDAPSAPPAGRTREVTDKLRDRLGLARLASAESTLRKSLSADALAREHEARWACPAEAITSDETSGAPELPFDALRALPEEDR
jgi:hypothetical protein